MGLKKFLGDLIDPGSWLSVTIENTRSGKSITLYHHQAEPSEVEHALREILKGTSDDEPSLLITIGEAKWLSDALRRSSDF